MRAGHRHELKTNTLAEWMGNLPQWTRDNLISIVIVIATIVAAGGFHFWRSYSRNAQLEEQYRFTSFVNQISNRKMQLLGAQNQAGGTSSILFEPARNLETFAKSTGDNNLAALAYIKQAEALRTELHYRTESVSDQDLAAQLGRAKQSYAMAVEKASDNPSLMAVAQFGIALCEEELGKFDEAKQIYARIAADDAFQGTATVVQAKLRLDTMDDYRKSVVFAPKPKPKPRIIPLKPAEIQLGPVDTNKPSAAAAPTVTIVPAEPNAPAKVPDAAAPTGVEGVPPSVRGQDARDTDPNAPAGAKTTDPNASGM
jgi:tetratricopeptide (TPR) repeat protein